MPRKKLTADELNTWLVSKFNELLSDGLEHPDIDVKFDPRVFMLSPSDLNPLGANWSYNEFALHISSNLKPPDSYHNSLRRVIDSTVREASEQFDLL